MPPKQRFTRKEVIDAALNLVRKNGIGAVTARAVAEALGSSSRPIFTIFTNMEDLIDEVYHEAKKIYNEYVKRGLAYEIPFKGVGQEYIKFAVEEPKLFSLLFMTENGKIPDTKSALAELDDNSSDILSTIKEQYGLNEEASRTLYLESWIFTHGIATLLAKDVCTFTGEEISSMLTDVCQGIIMKKRLKD